MMVVTESNLWRPGIIVFFWSAGLSYGSIPLENGVPPALLQSQCYSGMLRRTSWPITRWLISLDRSPNLRILGFQPVYPLIVAAVDFSHCVLDWLRWILLFWARAFRCLSNFLWSSLDSVFTYSVPFPYATHGRETTLASFFVLCFGLNPRITLSAWPVYRIHCLGWT